MIAIKDMEMPENCLACPVRNYRDGEGNRCDLTGLYNREDCCPLVEIVTCKDCRHWNFNENSSILCGYCSNFETETNEDFYCADAERNEKRVEQKN